MASSMQFFRRREKPCDLILVGLGNPGPRYAFTRHNMGFLVVDALIELLELNAKFELRWNALVKYAEVSLEHATRIIGEERLAKSSYKSRHVLIMKPQTFMNLSGRAVVRAVLSHRSVPILVICDDVNLPFGEVRMRARGSAGGHNGLQSIISELGTEDFMRLRIGVGGGELPDVTEFVLEPMNEEEIRKAKEVAKLAAKKALEILFLGFELASSFPIK